MLYREIIAVFSDIHTKPKLCGQNEGLLNVELVNLTTGIERVVTC
jgi:hypothetical protein